MFLQKMQVDLASHSRRGPIRDHVWWSAHRDGHVEVAYLETSRKTVADITSSGTANYFIHASHVTKTRHAHKVTAASLYTFIHHKRCKCTRKRTAASTMMQTNWNDFLHVDVNKIELFAFMSREIVLLPLAEGKELHATGDSGVLCSLAE